MGYDGTVQVMGSADSGVTLQTYTAPHLGERPQYFSLTPAQVKDLFEKLAAMMWQPMETAPKSTSQKVPSGFDVHGIYLIGFCPEKGASPESCIEIVYWEPHWHSTRGAWVACGNEVAPTKWMLAPKVPKP